MIVADYRQFANGFGRSWIR